MPPNSLTEQETTALHAYVNALQARFGRQLVDIILFGSKARGQARPDSDIDIVVILNHPDAQDLGQARGLAFDIWLAHQVLFSIRAISHRGWQDLAAMQSMFYRNVSHDGIPLLTTPA